MKKIYTADKETGTFIDRVDNVEQGIEMIAEYERKDKEDGVYTPDFYDVVDEDHCSVLD